MPANEQEKEAPKTEKRRAEDFSTRYANNVYLEPSTWDLKFIFGQLDLSLDPTKELILQHTAITLPWSQAKMLLYLLQVHIPMHEAQMGRVPVPTGLIYRVKGDMPPDFEQQFGENAAALWKKLRDNYDNFIEDNPEAE
jgi:hypothetical protein